MAYSSSARSGPRTYLQIVEAYRDPPSGKPRQCDTANLGRLDEFTGADIDRRQVTHQSLLRAMDAVSKK